MSSQALKMQDYRFDISDDAGPIQIREDHVGDIRGDVLLVNPGVSAMSAVKVRELFVHGTVRGTVEAEVVTVAKTGRIVGNVRCKHLRVKGVVEGGMVADVILLRDGGRLDGEVVAGTIKHTSDTVISGQVSIGPGMVARRQTFRGAPAPEIPPRMPDPAPVRRDIAVVHQVDLHRGPSPSDGPAPSTGRGRVKPFLLQN